MAQSPDRATRQWPELARDAASEQDSDKLVHLVDELCDALDKAGVKRKPAGSVAPRDSPGERERQ